MFSCDNCMVYDRKNIYGTLFSLSGVKIASAHPRQQGIALSCYTVTLYCLAVMLGHRQTLKCGSLFLLCEQLQMRYWHTCFQTSQMQNRVLSVEKLKSKLLRRKIAVYQKLVF